MWLRTYGDSPADRAAWDGFVAACPDGGVLQCSAWGDCKRQAGWRPLRLAAGDGSTPIAGAQILLRDLPLRMSRLAYCPRGPLGDWQSGPAADMLWPAVHQALRRQRALFLKIEPNTPPDPALNTRLRSLGFVPSPAHVQPVSTLQVDLTPDLETIRSAQKPKTRYNSGLAARKGVTISEGSPSDLPAVYPMLLETSQRDGFAIHTAAYYEALLRAMPGVSRLTLARHEGDLLAAIFVTAFGREAIYMHGASSNHKRNLMPTYLIQWQAMQWAKERGCAYYDLWGIPEDVQAEETEPTEAGSPSPVLSAKREGGLWGVFRFKSGFGGRLVRYAGSYDYVYSPLLYRLWTELLPRYRSFLLQRKGLHDDR